MPKCGGGCTGRGWVRLARAREEGAPRSHRGHGGRERAGGVFKFVLRNQAGRCATFTAMTRFVAKTGRVAGVVREAVVAGDGAAVTAARVGAAWGTISSAGVGAVVL